MRTVFNTTNKDHRRDLRNNSTDQERKLWSYLKNSQLGYKFRRQHSIGNYIVDFYCPERNLIIELDGSQHMDDERYDTERTKYFASLQKGVLRFWNNEVNESIDGVIMKIKEILR